LTVPLEVRDTLSAGDYVAVRRLDVRRTPAFVLFAIIAVQAAVGTWRAVAGDGPWLVAAILWLAIAVLAATYVLLPLLGKGVFEKRFPDGMDVAVRLTETGVKDLTDPAAGEVPWFRVTRCKGRGDLRLLYPEHRPHLIVSTRRAGDEDAAAVGAVIASKVQKRKRRTLAR